MTDCEKMREALAQIEQAAWSPWEDQEAWRKFIRDTCHAALSHEVPRRMTKEEAAVVNAWGKGSEPFSGSGYRKLEVAIDALRALRPHEDKS